MRETRRGAVICGKDGYGRCRNIVVNFFQVTRPESIEGAQLGNLANLQRIEVPLGAGKRVFFSRVGCQSWNSCRMTREGRKMGTWVEKLVKSRSLTSDLMRLIEKYLAWKSPSMSQNLNLNLRVNRGPEREPFTNTSYGVLLGVRIQMSPTLPRHYITPDG